MPLPEAACRREAARRSPARHESGAGAAALAEARVEVRPPGKGSAPEFLDSGVKRFSQSERQVDRWRIVSLLHGNDGLPAHINGSGERLLTHAELVSSSSDALAGEVGASIWPDRPARSGHGQNPGSAGSRTSRCRRACQVIPPIPSATPRSAPKPRLRSKPGPLPRAMIAPIKARNDSR